MKLIKNLLHIFILTIGFESIAFDLKNNQKNLILTNNLLPISEMSFCEISPSDVNNEANQFESELAKCNFQPRQNWNFSFTNKIIWTKFKLNNPNSFNMNTIILVNHIYLNQIQVVERDHGTKLLQIRNLGLDAVLNMDQKTTSGFSFTVDLTTNGGFLI
jgi:hypothetical protein